MPLEGQCRQGRSSSQRAQYAPDLFTRDALDFIDRHKAVPFFLFLTPTLPHANNERGRTEGNGMEVPSDAPYSNEPWPQVEKNHAAMITRLDGDVGKILAQLRELNLESRTRLCSSPATTALTRREALTLPISRAPDRFAVSSVLYTKVEFVCP